MKRILICALMLLALNAKAQYKAVDQGSELKFAIKNFGFNVDGSFTGLKGSINFDAQKPATAGFDVSIDAATVNTGNNMRDNHLKENSYFDVKNYPQLRLVATKVTGSGKDGAYVFTGTLSIKGKSKEISFPFTATPSADGLMFKGSFKINRKDFGVGGTSTIANELEVYLNVHAVKG